MGLSHYFKMLRVKDWIISSFWVSIIGAVLARASFETIVLIAVIYFCATAYSFVVNNYFDVEIDRKHKKKIESNTNPLAKGFVSKRGTMILLGILILIPFVLAIQMNFTGFVFVLLSILASTLYSAKYVRFKEKPVVDIVTYGFSAGFFPFLAGITLAGGSLSLPIILMGVLFIILEAGGLLDHQITDYYQDLENTRNFAIKIGRKRSCIFLILLVVASLLCLEIILQFFTVEWWLHYSLIIFLILCHPIHCIKEIRKDYKLIIKQFV